MAKRSGIQSTLQKKYGPLPLWGWLVAGGAAYYLYTRSKGAGVGAAAAVGAKAGRRGPKGARGAKGRRGNRGGAGGRAERDGLAV